MTVSFPQIDSKGVICKPLKINRIVTVKKRHYHSHMNGIFEEKLLTSTILAFLPLNSICQILYPEIFSSIAHQE